MGMLTITVLTDNTLFSSDVAKFFEPSITAIIKIVEDQCKFAKAEISVSSNLPFSGLFIEVFLVRFPCWWVWV